MTTTDRQDVLIVAVVKGAERYVIAYDDESINGAVVKFAMWMADPTLSFDEKCFWRALAEIQKK